MQSPSKTFLERKPDSDFAEVIRCIGHDLADKVIAEFGGHEFNIPVPDAKRMKGTKLYKLIGEEATQKLIREFGHGRVAVPISTKSSIAILMEQRREKIEAMLRRGASLSAVAAEMGCTREAIKLHRRRLRESGLIPEYIPPTAGKSSAA